jgi:hypothetical protein
MSSKMVVNNCCYSAFLKASTAILAMLEMVLIYDDSANNLQLL